MNFESTFRGEGVENAAKVWHGFYCNCRQKTTLTQTTASYNFRSLLWQTYTKLFHAHHMMKNVKKEPAAP